MDTPHSTEERTLETLRETARVLENGLTEARRAIAELEARLTWSHSRTRDTEMFTRDHFRAAPSQEAKTPPPATQT